jgi:hypothetical protein
MKYYINCKFARQTVLEGIWDCSKLEIIIYDQDLFPRCIFCPFWEKKNALDSDTP